MNISLPDSLKDFVDQQVHSRGFGTSSEYIRELIRHDQERTELRALLIEGLASPEEIVDEAWFSSLRVRNDRSALE